MSVLITEVEGKLGLAITQSLGRKGISVSCLSNNPSAPAFYSKYCKEKFVSPAVEDKDSYINFLLDIVKRNKYELLITCSDADTEYISEIRESLYSYITFLLPDHETVMRVLNKDKLMRFCVEKNFAIPKTEFPKNIEDVITFNGQFDYPLVLKGTRGAGAQNVEYAHSKYELVYKYIELIEKAPQAIIQEYIPGDNYCWYGLCDSGKVISFFMYRILRSYPVTGGTPAKAVSMYDEALNKYAAGIIEALNWSGMINLDLKKDKNNGQYKLMEINPRFGGTTPLAIASGIDFPLQLYKLVVKGERECVNTYKINKVFRSLFREEILYLVDRPRDIPKLLFDFLNPFIDYGINLNDLAPLIGLMKRAKWELIYRYRATHNTKRQG